MSLEKIRIDVKLQQDTTFNEQKIKIYLQKKIFNKLNKKKLKKVLG